MKLKLMSQAGLPNIPRVTIDCHKIVESSHKPILTTLIVHDYDLSYTDVNSRKAVINNIKHWC